MTIYAGSLPGRVLRGTVAQGDGWDSLAVPSARVPPPRRGDYEIVATAKRLGLAGEHRIGLGLMGSMEIIAETRSAADGAYVFTNLALIEQGYFTIALDDGGTPVNGAISSHITPTAMA